MRSDLFCKFIFPSLMSELHLNAVGLYSQIIHPPFACLLSSPTGVQGKFACEWGVDENSLKDILDKSKTIYHSTVGATPSVLRTSPPNTQLEFGIIISTFSCVF